MVSQSIHPFLSRQGVIWLLLATAAEIPPLVCLISASQSLPIFVHLQYDFTS